MGQGLPGRHNSGIPALSSERRAPGGPPGTSSEGPMEWRYQGVPLPAGTARWPGTARRERRKGVGYRELRQGGGVRGSPWGPGGVPQSREGAGRGWADAAETAGWVTGPGWIWGSLERKEKEGKDVTWGRRGAGGYPAPLPQKEPDTFAGDPVTAEPVPGAAGAEVAARRVVAGVLARSALSRPPALVDIWGTRGTRRCRTPGNSSGMRRDVPSSTAHA